MRGAAQMLGMMMTVNAIEHLDRHAEKPVASHLSTPFCISQVAAVWRNVCGLIHPLTLAKRSAVLNAVFTDSTGRPFHSTKYTLMMPLAAQRRRWASRRRGSGTGGWRLLVARAPSARR